MLYYEDWHEASLDVATKQGISGCFGDKQQCTYCGHAMHSQVRTGFEDPFDGGDYVNIKLHLCISCGWWFAWDTCYHSPDWHDTLYLGIHKRFNFKSKNAAIDQVNGILKNVGLEKIRDMHPTAMEKFIQSLLKDYLDCEVRHVGGPGDHGIDLLAIIDNNPVAIQVKRRTKPSTEPIEQVRAFVGTMYINGLESGMYITTSKEFSKSTNTEVQLAAMRGLKLDLLAFRDIQHIFNMNVTNSQMQIYEPWLPLYEKSLLLTREQLEEQIEKDRQWLSSIQIVK